MSSRTPTTPAEIAASLRSMSKRMIQIGTAMDYYGGFGGRMAARGQELVWAGGLAKTWADDIEIEANETKEPA
jgi:hypothetical protein